MKKLIFLLMAAVLTGSIAVQAGEFASWNFQAVVSGDNNSWTENSYTNAPVTSNVVAQGVFSTATNGHAGTGNNSLKMTHIHEADLAAAIADQDYFEIRLDASAGTLLSITQLVVTLDDNTEAKGALLVDADQNGFDTGDDVTGELDLSLGGNSAEDEEWLFALSTPASTSAVVRLYLYGTANQYKGQLIGEGWSGFDTDDDVVVYGTASAATGPADLAYTATPHSIKPGEPQDIDVVIRNDGFNATNIVSTLSSANGNFSVLSGSPITNAALAGGASITNTFSVQAVSNTVAQIFSGAFNLNIAGYGNDGSPDTANANVAVTVLNTAFAAMDDTGFASDVSGMATNTLTITNSAAFDLQFAVDTTQPWLSTSTNGGTLAAGGTTMIDVVADANQTPGQGQYTDTLSVTWLNNGSQPNPAELTVQFDVGPKITPRVDQRTVIEAGGVNLFPGLYEPGEILSITVPSTNDGAITVNNITNTMTLPAGWGNPVPVSDVYGTMAVGDSTSTTYQVSIPAGADDGNHTVTVQNDAGTGSIWSESFTLNVFSQADPDVSTNALTIHVVAGSSADASLFLTNSGNKTVDFSLSDSFDWPFGRYEGAWSQIGADDWVDLGWEYWETNTRFTVWNGDSSDPMPIGFDFPLYGTVYTEFSAGVHGAIALGGGTVPENPSGSFTVGNNPIVAPFWSSLSLDDKIEQVRYSKEDDDRLIVSWINAMHDVSGGGSGLQFQLWLHDDGRMTFLYKDLNGSALDNAAVGVQDPPRYSYAVSTPAEGWRLDVHSTTNRWVTYSPADESVGGLDSQTITFTADAAEVEAGTTETFDVVVSWEDGSSDIIAVTVVVDDPDPSLDSPTDVVFAGPAGLISQTAMVISNDGNIAIEYQISETSPVWPGYTVSGTGYDWIYESGLESIPNVDVFDGDTEQEAVSDLMPIGFDFPLYGQTYSTFAIGVNGAVSLGAAGPMTYEYSYTEDGWNPAEFNEINSLSLPALNIDTNVAADVGIYSSLPTLGPVTTLPNQSPAVIGFPDQMIAPYWQTLQPDEDTDVWYFSDGQRLVVTWEGLSQLGGGTNQTFQIMLNADGEILFQYQDITGYDVWKNAEIGLRNTAQYSTNLAFEPQIESVVTNYSYVTETVGEYTSVIETNVDSVVTTYVDTVSGAAAQFTPEASTAPVIVMEPDSGTLAVGASQVIDVYGDGRGMTGGGGNSVATNIPFNITYADAFGNGGTNNVDVLFGITNAVEDSFVPKIDSDGDGVSDAAETMFGSDAVVTVTQDKDGNRTVSWPKPAKAALYDRVFTVWYTTDLLAGWTPLATLTNATSFVDTEHSDAPVIYYRVTVE